MNRIVMKILFIMLLLIIFINISNAVAIIKPPEPIPFQEQICNYISFKIPIIIFLLGIISIFLIYILKKIKEHNIAKKFFVLLIISSLMWIIPKELNNLGGGLPEPDGSIRPNIGYSILMILNIITLIIRIIMITYSIYTIRKNKKENKSLKGEESNV